MAPRESSGQVGRGLASHVRWGAGKEGEEGPHTHSADGATASSSQKHSFELTGWQRFHWSIEDQRGSRPFLFFLDYLLLMQICKKQKKQLLKPIKINLKLEQTRYEILF